MLNSKNQHQLITSSINHQLTVCVYVSVGIGQITPHIQAIVNFILGKNYLHAKLGLLACKTPRVLLKETMNTLIPSMIRQAFIPVRVHHKRNQPLTVRLYTLKGTSALEDNELVKELINQSFLKPAPYS